MNFFINKGGMFLIFFLMVESYHTSLRSWSRSRNRSRRYRYESRHLPICTKYSSQYAFFIIKNKKNQYAGNFQHLLKK